MAGSDSEVSQRRVLRDRPRAVTLLVLGAVSVGLGALVLTSEPQTAGDRFPAAVLAAVCGFFAVWCLFAAKRGVKVLDEGVQLKYLVRSRFLRWSDVAYFGLAETRNWFGERLRKPMAVCVDGKRFIVPGADKVSWFGEGAAGKHFAVLDELERLRRQRSRYRS